MTLTGYKLFDLRKASGVTQERLVKEVPQLKRHTLQDIERGRVFPSEELAQAILDAIERLKVKP